MRHASFIAAVLFAVAGAAAAADWQVQPAQSELRFVGSQQGQDFEGRFHRFEAGIRFDPADLGGARFDVEIDLASADSDNSERDETLHGPDFFNVAANPVAQYRAASFRSDGDGFVAEGTLTLKGNSHPVALRFDWTPDGHGAVLEGSARLDRLQFGVGAGDWSDPDAIGHAVTVHTKLHLVPAAE